MNAYDTIYQILKMGVSLPDDSKELRTHRNIGDGKRKFISESRNEEYHVPHEVGVYPDNPDDPYHGFTPAPFYSSTNQGYHPEVTTILHAPDIETESHLTMPSEDNNVSTQMHQQLGAGAHSDSPIDNLVAAAIDELHRRAKKDDNIE